MKWILRDSIQPETWKSIQKNEYIYQNETWTYTCGCKPDDGQPETKFSLCDYHGGFDDCISDDLDFRKKILSSEIENKIYHAPYIVVYRSSGHFDIMELRDSTLQFPYYYKIAESNNQLDAAKILNSLINTHKFS